MHAFIVPFQCVCLHADSMNVHGMNNTDYPYPKVASKLSDAFVCVCSPILNSSCLWKGKQTLHNKYSAICVDTPRIQAIKCLVAQLLFSFFVHLFHSQKKKRNLKEIKNSCTRVRSVQVLLCHAGASGERSS